MAQNMLMIHDGLNFSSHDLCLLVVWNAEGFLVP